MRNPASRAPHDARCRTGKSVDVAFPDCFAGDEQASDEAIFFRPARPVRNPGLGLRICRGNDGADFTFLAARLPASAAREGLGALGARCCCSPRTASPPDRLSGKRELFTTDNTASRPGGSPPPQGRIANRPRNGRPRSSTRPGGQPGLTTEPLPDCREGASRSACRAGLPVRWPRSGRSRMCRGAA
jgi:hypothetical protein